MSELDKLVSEARIARGVALTAKLELEDAQFAENAARDKFDDAQAAFEAADRALNEHIYGVGEVDL